MSAGRPLKFATSEEIKKEADKYFKWADDNPWIKFEPIRSGDRVGELIDIPTQRPYTIIAMCHYMDINKDTWYEYEKRSEFTDITTRIHDKIRNQKYEGAVVGAFNANIIARDLGLTDMHDHTIHSEQPLYPPLK